MDWKLNEELYYCAFDYKIAQFYGSLGIKTVEELLAHPHYYCSITNDDGKDFNKEIESAKEFEEDVKNGVEFEFGPECDSGYIESCGFGSTVGLDMQLYGLLNDDTGEMEWRCGLYAGSSDGEHWSNDLAHHYKEDIEYWLKIDIHDPNVKETVEKFCHESFLKLLKLCEDGRFDDYGRD